MTKVTVLPETQYAVQLVGPGEVRLNRSKEVFRPGPRQIVARIEAVGLCFSDLKLLKQFTAHVRKSEVVGGLTEEELAGIPSYAPGTKPTVPGHEAVCEIVVVGRDVRHHKLGERCLIQTDYRQIPTARSNAAFGYNFEGALQEYLLMDERMIVDPANGQRYLIPVDDTLSAAAVCLVEPWACVEDSYVTVERNTIKAGGRLLVVAEPGRRIEGIERAFCAEGKPAELTAICAEDRQRQALTALGPALTEAASGHELPDQAFDDIVYFGADRPTIEVLNDKLAANGIINLVTGGEKIGEPVSVDVGRLHYGLTRWVGTTGADAAESYRHIPHTGEIRPGEKIAVIGAGGPMGQMHVIRNICASVEGISVTATDLDETRLASLLDKAGPLAQANSVELLMGDPQERALNETFTYFALMAPVPALVADAVRNSAEGCLINVFAGIPAGTRGDLDLDTYLANHCFMFGTSGSEIRDMMIVLDKVRAGRLDTNCSVDAVSGMAGACEGIAAVENRTLAGKIIVYPDLRQMGLIPLADMHDHFPTVAARLVNGQWSKAAEEELLKVARG